MSAKAHFLAFVVLFVANLAMFFATDAFNRLETATIASIMFAAGFMACASMAIKLFGNDD